MITPYPYQIQDEKELLAHDATGFIVAETGAGKTIAGTRVAHLSGVPTKLIIAPAGTHKKVWERTILEVDENARVQRIDGTDPGKRAMDDLEWKRPGYYLMTPQIFTRWKPTGTIRPDMTILDEAHLLSNRDTVGAQELLKLKTGHKIPMSGTIYRNNFENFWTLLRWVYPERNGHGDIADISFWRWVKEFCETEYDHFKVGNVNIVGELNPGTIAGLIPCYIQHFKRQECCQFHPQGFLHDLPEPVVIPEVVQMVPAQKKAILQMEEEYVAWLKDQWENDKVLITKLPLTKAIRLSQMTLGVPTVEKYFKTVTDSDTGGKRQVEKTRLIFMDECEAPKFDKLVEIYRKVAEPVVAATNSKEFAEMAVRRLNKMGIRAFEWSSAASATARDQALEDFEKGLLDIVVGVTESISTGIDGLQQASGVLVSLNKSRDLTSETQLSGRLDRRGQKRTAGVLVYNIIAEGSTDEEIISTQLRRQLAIQRSLKRALRKDAA